MKRARQIIFRWLSGRLVLSCALALLAHAGCQSFAADLQASVETAPMQFVPDTSAERELEKILSSKGGDMDLASVNWLIAADIPEFSSLTREEYFKQLDVMTEQVRRDTAKMQKVALVRGESLTNANTR